MKLPRNVEKSIKSNLNNIYDIMVHVEPLGNLEEDEKYGITESDLEHQKNQQMITKEMHMCQAVLENPQLLPLFPRFNMKLGFGEMNVEEVCTCT